MTDPTSHGETEPAAGVEPNPPARKHLATIIDDRHGWTLHQTTDWALSVALIRAQLDDSEASTLIDRLGEPTGDAA